MIVSNLLVLHEDLVHITYTRVYTGDRLKRRSVCLYDNRNLNVLVYVHNVKV